MILTVDDYKSKSYIDVFDAFDVIDLSLRYGSDDWTKVFSGKVSTAAPRLSRQGEVLDVVAWGKGYGTVKTHCNSSYGLESERPTKDTPQEILVDLVTWFINRSFGNASTTGWNFASSKIENVHSGLSVTYLPGLYQNNFTLINRLCDIVNAYAQGLSPPQVGIHWYVNPDACLYVKKIDADHSDGTWDRYWKETQDASTITVKEDMILYNFRKNIEEYANHIVLQTSFRRPNVDYLTEDSGGAPLWVGVNANISNSAIHIVGSHSLLIESTTSDPAYGYYPSTEDAGWDLTRCGSEETIPHIGFYFRKNSNVNVADVRLFTADYDTNFFYIDDIFGLGSGADDTWEYYRLPLGPYYSLEDENVRFRWAEVGSPLWSDIDGICFVCNGNPEVTSEMYIDDLHISGKIIREAYFSGTPEYQRVIRNDAALDDTLNAGDDSGLAARLAYAELLRRAQTPIVGMIEIPMAVDMLPGQTVHIHACQKSDDTYRINQDFRVKELKHVILPTQTHGFRTQLNLTSDLTNTHAFGVPSQYSLLMEYAGALGHAEARDLKSSGIDTKIPRLSKLYT